MGDDASDAGVHGQGAGAPRIVSSVLSTTLAALLVLTVTTGELWLVAAAVLLVQVLVASAPRPAGLDDVRWVSFVPVVLGCVVATGLAYDPGVLAGTRGTQAARDALVSSGVLAGMLLGVAVVVALVLVGQMLRRDGRERLVVSASSAVMLGVVATLAAGWVAAAATSLALDVVLMAALGLSAALLVWALPGDRVVLASAAVVVGSLAGASAPLVVDGPGTWVLGVALGGAAAGCGLLGQVLGRAWTAGTGAGPDAWAFPAAASVALAGPVVHLGGQLAVLVV